MKFILFIFISFYSVFSYAEKCEPVCSYYELSVGHVLQGSQDYTVTYDGINKKDFKLYEGDIHYSLKAGVRVPSKNGNYLLIGVSWSDLLDQPKASKELSRPYLLEPFIDYESNYSSGFYTHIGVGYKLGYDNRIKGQAINDYCDCYASFIANKTILDRLTARLSLGYRVNDSISISLDHNSQWLKGKPLGNDWEYQLTKLSINLVY